MTERIDVFISSTSRDLTAYRDAVTNVILRLGLHPIIMEAFNPTDRNALQLCYDEVQEAEIFIGIYAHRYGYAPGSDVTYRLADGSEMTGDGETGITHLEYLWAVERDLPLLLFVVDETLAWPPEAIEDEPGKSRLRAFKKMIGSNHVWGTFTSPDNLAAQVATGLAELKAQFYALDDPTTPPESTRCDFYKHIQLPANYIPRTELLAELRSTLLDDDDTDPAPANKKPVALHGMGGIGKSVMARALCDDPAVQAAFPDGILWTTLGQEPNLITKLREWVDALGGTISENVLTENSLKATLAELLEDRTCLLVVDDVWQKKHAEAFRVGGENCRLLLTTRDAYLVMARTIGANKMQLIPTMSVNEAVELLREAASGNLADTDTGLLTTIVRRLGLLPLALDLAGEQLQRQAPEKWLKRFDVRKIESARPNDVHDSLKLTFEMSLDELEDVTRKLYAALAIFKENEPIHEQAITYLWSVLDDLDEDDTEELLDDLAARALLIVAGDEYPRAAVLHDLLRNFMAAELEDPHVPHAALLEAYRKTQTGDGWHTAPDDGYLYDHLAYHLIALEQYTVLSDLLHDYRFLYARLDAGDTNRLLADFERLLHAPAQLAEDTVLSLTLLSGAIRLAAHIVEENADQLAGQLVGRLMIHDQPRLTAFLRQLRDDAPETWLEPLVPSLASAGGAWRRTLYGHRDPVWWLEISHDNRLVVSGSEDRVIIVWDLADGTQLHRLKGHEGVVASLRISRDGKQVVSGSHDTTVRLWDIESESEIMCFTEHEKPVWAVALNDAADKILSADTSGCINLYQRDTQGNWRYVQSLIGHTRNIWEVIFSPDGTLAASASVDRQVIVWNLATGTALHRLLAHEKAANCVTFSADGKTLYSGGADGRVCVWDLTTGELRQQIEAHTLTIWAIYLDAAEQIAVTFSVDNAIKVWRLPDWSLIRDINEQSVIMYDGSITDDGHIGVSGHDDGTIKIWDLTQDSVGTKAARHDRAVYDVTIGQDGTHALTACADHTVGVWNLTDYRMMFSLTGHQEAVWKAVFAPDGKHILTASADRTLKWWDAASGQELGTLTGHTGAVRTVALSADGSVAVSGSNDRTLRVWDMPQGTLRHVLTGTARLHDVVIIADGLRALSADAAGFLRLWDLVTGQEIAQVDTGMGAIHALSVCPAGVHVVTACKKGVRKQDKSILQRWKIIGDSLEHEQDYTEIHDDEETIWDVFICHDAATAISTASDQTMQVWNMMTGEILATFTGEAPLLTCDLFLSAGTAVVGSRSGSVHFLKLHTRV